MEILLWPFPGSKPADQSQCSASPVQHQSHDHRPHHDVGHQRGCLWYVSICPEDGCSRYSQTLQVTLWPRPSIDDSFVFQRQQGKLTWNAETMIQVISKMKKRIFLVTCHVMITDSHIKALYGCETSIQQRSITSPGCKIIYFILNSRFFFLGNK